MSGIGAVEGTASPQYSQPYNAAAGTAEQIGTVEQTETVPPLPDPGEEEIKSLHEMLKEAREKAEAQRERLKLPKNNAQYSAASMEAYARLARARTQSDVSAAAGYARRQIMRFKAAKAQDSENADRIQAAINQLQKAVARAGKKKRDLTKEDLLKARRIRKARENQRQAAQRIDLELRRRKSMRVIRESGYIREAEIDSRLQAQLAQTRMELRAQAQELSAATAASLDSAAQQYAAQSAPASAPSVSVDLQA